MAGTLWVFAGLGCHPGFDDGAVVWQGFEQAWSYNHRINRQGSWVAQAACATPSTPCEAESAHAAASGFGADTAVYTARRSVVRADEVAFFWGSDTRRIDSSMGAEALSGRYTASFEKPDKKTIRNRCRYEVVLNGFDLISNNAADKPGSFDLWVEDARWDPSEKSLEVSWGAALALACSSPECFLNGGPDSVDYSITAHFLVMAHDGEALGARRKRVSDYSGWEAPPSQFGGGSNPDALPLEPAAIAWSAEGLEADLVAIRALSVSMESTGEQSSFEGPDMHLLTWNTSVHDVQTRAAGVDFLTELFLDNWAEDMQDLQPTSFPEPGFSEVSMDLLLLEFLDENRVEELPVSGSLVWDPLAVPEQDPRAPEAVATTPTTLDLSE
jgi:hypothetical protein